MNQPVILFDGVCVLCQSSVQFVIKRDKEKRFKFASLQSEFGKRILEEHQIPMEDHLTSMILYEDGKIYRHSTAALHIARRLNGLWPTMYGFIIVPPFIRNAVYNFIGAHRYQWFGKTPACWVPTEDVQDRFLK